MENGRTRTGVASFPSETERNPHADPLIKDLSYRHGGTMTTSGLATGYATTTRPVLLIAEASMASDAEQAIARAGSRMLRRIGWADVPHRLAEPMLAPLLMAEARGVAADILDLALARLEGFAVALDVPLILSFGRDQLDQVAAALSLVEVTLLCDPEPFDRILALAMAGHPHGPPMLSDSLRENDGVRLQRLNDEVARIAEILARLARADHGPGGDAYDLADRHRGYDAGPTSGGEPVEPTEVRRLIQLRRLRGKFFGGFGQGLFEDPAWDMLLDLYAAELEDQQVSVSSLCIAAAVAPTTALRWIAKMTDLGLLARHPDPADRRRAFMALSRRASEAMRNDRVAARRVEGSLG